MRSIMRCGTRRVLNCPGGKNMRLNILPKEEKFFKYFEEQANIICEAASVLQELMEKFGDGQTRERVQRLNDLEHRGDDITHELTLRLYKSFVTPIDREDMHSLSHYLDDVLDYIQGSGIRLQLYKVKKITSEAKQLGSVILQATRCLREAINSLRSFSDLTEIARKIKELEREGDEINRKAVAELFDNVADAAYIIKWKEIYQSLETATDKCEDVMDILQGVILKHA